MNIFVAKLSPVTNQDSLEELFQNFGDVQSVKVIIDRETGKSKGYGFVEMSNDSEARKAIEELNESEFQGSKIVVKESMPKGNHSRDNRSKKPFRKRY